MESEEKSLTFHMAFVFDQSVTVVISVVIL